MQYKNGREAKNGDKVVRISPYNGTPPTVGILYDAVAGNDTCNGRLAAISQNDPMPNLAECLHVDDILDADIPDSTTPPPAAASPATDAPAGDGAGSSATDAATAPASS